ncbi:hypothetical protein AZSI13_32230 [Azospira sp. I13]|uniref:hypothetical protein n=1 Tax=Azospira sp. I13 TaxID=1765050 RepID=UPI000D47568B|nr:hypothetical protein [Azospira sp. I13]GBG03896.1 hypothetical protein AZSI13_32230 [Azospira sp. I13]
MLRFAYHLNGKGLSHAALRRWCRGVVDAGLAGVVAPGDVVELTTPSLPWAFEQSVVADDRVSEGGKSFSRIKYTGREGVWTFANVQEAEVPAWRSWYLATAGGRLPFVLEFRDVLHVVVAPGPFPLVMQRAEIWAGQLTVREAL